MFQSLTDTVRVLEIQRIFAKLNKYLSNRSGVLQISHSYHAMGDSADDKLTILFLLFLENRI